MQSDKSLLFPRLNQIGRKLQPVLESPCWLPVVLAIAALLYLPSLFTGFFADDNNQRLGFSSEALQKLDIGKDKIDKGIMNLYAFSGFDNDRWEALRDKGIFPWWSGENIRINFFRPLSSLTLALDYTLWPGSPLLMHIHSLLWFLLLLVIVSRVYRYLFTSRAVAGLALLLFAIDDVNAGISWICNRHGVVAMVFGVLGLLFYIKGREKKSLLVFSYVSLALSLLASEMGAIGFVFVFSYTIVLDDRPIGKKTISLFPLFAIGITWLVIRSYLDYGVTGSILYIDPIRSPWLYIANLPVRFIVLLASVTGLPIADMLMLLSPTGSAITAMVSLVFLCIGVILVRRIIGKSRVAIFWAAGLLLSIPLLASGFLRNTILGFPGLGMMGLAAFLFHYLSKASTQEFKYPIRTGLKVLVPWIFFCFVLVGPLYIAAIPATFGTSVAVQTKLTNFEKAGEVDGRYLIVIDPPSVSTMEAGLTMRLFSDKAIPLYLRYLTSGGSPVKISRLDENTIEVTPRLPFPLRPEEIRDEKTGRTSHFHPDILNRRTDSFYYDWSEPPQSGEIIRLTGVTITIGRVTGDGRITSVIFRFDKKLEDPYYTWLGWDTRNQQYVTGRMPVPGETIEY